MLPADARRGRRAGMVGPNCPPPARPRVALVVGLTDVPAKMYPMKPVSSLMSISDKTARSRGKPK